MNDFELSPQLDLLEQTKKMADKNVLLSLMENLPIKPY